MAFEDKFEMIGLPVHDFESWYDIWLGGCIDWREGELNSGGEIPGMIQYFPYACQVCHRSRICQTGPNVSLSKCSKCKRVYYCGRNHQAKDWSKHKKTCELLAAIPLLTAPTSSAEEYSSILKRDYFQFGLRQFSQRSGHEVNNDQLIGTIWMSQPHCQSCFVQSNLTPCIKCSGVAHCDKSECLALFPTLHNVLSCERNCIRIASYVMALQQGMKLNIATKTRNSREVAENFPYSWAQFFNLKIEDYEVPPQLLQLPPVVSQLTHSTSPVLTIINSLKLIESRGGLKEKSKMVIHIIGSRSSDSVDGKFEEILHWFPQCTEIDVVCIGPEAIGPRAKMNASSFICNGCKSNGCRIFVSAIQQLYHEAISVGLLTDQPTVAVCFNSGIHEGDSNDPSSLISMWSPTLKLLYDTAIPTVFTAYSEADISQDFLTLVDVCGIEIEPGIHYDSKHTNSERATSSVFISPPGKNPYKSLLPIPEPAEDNRFFYENDQYMILYGTR